MSIEKKNIETTVSTAVVKTKKKALPVTIASICAMSVMTVTAFATDGTSTGIDYAGIIDSLVNGFSDIISNCVDMAVAIIPLGLGFLGLGKMWDVGKRFFTKTTSG